MGKLKNLLNNKTSIVFLFLVLFILSSGSILAADNNLIKAIIGDPSGGGGSDRFKFYCQYGAVNDRGIVTERDRHSWDYGSCDIYGSGCAMTALASIMTYFGDNKTPSQVSRDNGGMGCASPGTRNSDAKEIVQRLSRQGYKIPGSSSGGIFGDLVNRNFHSSGYYTGTVNLRNLKQNYIDKGYLLWAGAKIKYAERSGLTGFGGHAFTVTDINPDNGTMTVYDPTFCQGGFPNLQGGKRTLRNVNSLSGDFGCDGNCGWTMLWAIKK